MQLETVLCPIDFSPLTEFEVRLATEVCETFGARLVLHHNLAAAAPGLAKAWEWEEAHHSAAGGAPEVSESAARDRMEELLADIPSSVSAEARISRGPVGLVLLYLIEEVAADLVILGSHGWSDVEHVSLSERIIEKSSCPVLAFQEGRGEGAGLRLRGCEADVAPRILVTTVYSESAAAAVRYAFELARATPLKLHLLHVQTGRPQMVPVDPIAPAVESAVEATRVTERRLLDMLPEDLAGDVSCEVATGTVGDCIVERADELDAELIVMGEHAPGFLRHYFTHDTAREMLHRARCPVWYVPP